MGTSIKFQDTNTLLAEADELVQRLNSMVSEDVTKTHQIEFEKRLKEIKNIRSKMQDKIAKLSESEENSSYAEGFHEAYQEIVQAIKNLKELLN